MRRTLADALSSRLPVTLNISPSDARCVQWINSAQEILLTRGHWWDTMATYEVSTPNNTLTLPPQFATVEGITVNRGAMGVQSKWYQWSRNGPGFVNPVSANTYPQPNTINVGQCVPLGNYCSFGDINPPPNNNGNPHQVRLQCDVLADVGLQVLVLGYDNASPPNWIQSQVNGVWQDGILMTLAQTPGTLSTNGGSPQYFSKVTDLQFPTLATGASARSGQVWMYDYDTVLATNTLIGQYARFESRPRYQRYLIPVAAQTSTPAIVDVFGKLAFVPVYNPTDYLIISNLEALKMACLSVKASEEHNFQDAALYLNGGAGKAGAVTGAIQILEAELDHYSGSAEETTIQFPVDDDPVMNLI